MAYLTREEALGFEDITTKEIDIPEHIPAWGGHKVRIRQLTRGQQDEYLRRQFGSVKMKQDSRAKQQELTSAQMYGHDAWLVVRGLVDEIGNSLFTEKDIPRLNEKNGEAIGWIGKQIVAFSAMKQEVDEVQALENVESELKNY